VSYINKLYANNFKGCTFTDSLAPVTLYLGRNSHGKSARLQALSLALCGQLPGERADGQPLKSNSELFTLLASATPMTAGCVFDTGETMVRTWEQISGSVKCKVVTSRPDMATVLINPVELLALTGPERTRALLARASLGPEWTPQQLWARVCADIKNIDLNPNTTETERAVSVLLDQLNYVVRGTMKLGTSPAVWLAGLEAELKKRKLLADQGLERMRHTSQGLSQVRPAPANQEAEIKRDKALKEFAIASSEKQLADTRLQELETEFYACESAANAKVDEQAIQDVKDLESAGKHLTEQRVPDPGGDEVRLPLEQALHKTSAAHNKAATDCKVLDAEMKRLDKELDELQASKVCPKCGQSLKTLQAKLIKQLKSDLKTVVGKVNKAVEVFNETADAHRIAEDKLIDYQAAKATYEEWRAQLRQVAATVVEHRERLALSIKAAQSVEQARARLGELQTSREIARGNALSALEGLNLAKTKLEAAEADYKLLLAERAETASRARVAEEAGRVQAEAQVLKAAVKLVSELQVQLLAEAIGPVVTRANKLCAPVLPGKLVFQDGEFGMVGPNGNLVTHRAMSDSEKLLAMAGLSVALATGQPYKVAAIGRFESFDKANQSKIITLLRNLVRDKELDQAILIQVGLDNEVATSTAGLDFKVVIV
jgi:hypothetical protein